MKVYLVWVDDYEASYVQAVYSNKEEAQKHINKNNYDYTGDPQIIEEEVLDRYESD